VLEKTGARAFTSEASTIAKRFVTARASGEPLPGFPGRLPADLAAAYACQDAAIGLVDDTIAGW
jgi:2-keto-4-pentenoate hydratase